VALMIKFARRTKKNPRPTYLDLTYYASLFRQYHTYNSDSNQAGTPLRLLREESIDANGALSPMSTRSNGTDTETDMDSKKKVR